MKLAYLILGFFLAGLGWWVQQPIYFWIWPLPNPLAFLGIPLMICGAALILYGLTVHTKTRRTRTSSVKTGTDAKFILALLIAGFFDVLDWIVVGFIPVAGDVLDVLAIVFLFPLIGQHALIGVVEFIPLADILPCNIASVVAWKLSQK